MMLKIFLKDLFQSIDELKIFLRIIFYLFLFFIFSFVVFCCKNFFSKNISIEDYRIFFFIISYIGSLLIDYRQQRILTDVAIHKGVIYKFIFMVFNSVFSWPVILYLSSIIVFKGKIYICFLNFLFLLFSIMLTLCFNRKIIVKMLILCINSIVIIFNSPIIVLPTLIVFCMCYFIFFDKCFDEYEVSNIKSNVIESQYSYSKLRTSILMEWLFIIREKKGLLFTSLFCSFGILCFFEYLRRYNPCVFFDLSNFRLLLLSSFISGSFITIFGPYMMNWFYYYSDDLLSKNWLIRDIIEGKIRFLEIVTVILFLVCVPFIIIFHLNIFMMVYFFIMNSSVSVLIALIFGITEISKIDTTKSPRLRVEKGSVLNTYIPWICEFFSVLIFIFLYGKLPLFGIVIFSIVISGIIHLLNERIIEKFVLVINQKILVRNTK